MKRKFFDVLSIALIALVVVACNQSGPNGPVIIGGGNRITAETVASSFNQKQFNLDVQDTLMKTRTVEGLSATMSSEPTAAVAVFSADAAPRAITTSVVYITVDFSGYQNSSSTYISDGQMVLTASGSNTTGTLELESYEATTTESLVIRTTRNGASSSDSVEIRITTAEIKGSVTFTAEGAVGSIAKVEISTPAQGSGSTIVVGNEEIPVDQAEGIPAGNGGMFAGGYGTRENPYEIATKTQLLNISTISKENPTAYPYFILTSDIDIEYDDFIEVLSGELNGDGHSINVVGDVTSVLDEKTNQYTTDTSYLVEKIGKAAEITDLEYNTKGRKSLVYGYGKVDGIDVSDSLMISYVTVSGELEGSTNISPFVIYASSRELGFIHCTNNADIYGTASTYGAPFLAYIVGYDDSATIPDTRKLTFDSCVNNGNIVMQGAAFILGNGGNAGNFARYYTTGETDATDKVLLIITDCVNNGAILGLKNMDWFTWNPNDPESQPWTTLNDYAEANISGSGRSGVVTLEGLALSASLNESQNVELKITCPTDDPTGTKYKYVYQKSYYGRFYRDESRSAFAGTLRTVHTCNDPDDVGAPSVDVADLTIMQENGKNLYPEAPAKNDRWDYSVTVYDNGVPIGTATCKYNG